MFCAICTRNKVPPMNTQVQKLKPFVKHYKLTPFLPIYKHKICRVRFVTQKGWDANVLFLPIVVPVRMVPAVIQ